MEAKQKIENRNFSKNKNEIENQNPRWNKRWFEGAESRSGVARIMLNLETNSFPHFDTSSSNHSTMLKNTVEFHCMSSRAKVRKCLHGDQFF